jgi:hypothetical protein
MGGKIKDAYSKEAEFVSVMLYKTNDNLNDSIVYENPDIYKYT